MKRTTKHILLIVACLLLGLFWQARRVAGRASLPPATSGGLPSGGAGMPSAPAKIHPPASRRMAVRGGRAFESTRGALAEDGEPVFQVLSVTPQETRVRFRLPTVEISETEVNGRSYSVVKAAGGYAAEIEGAPELPRYRCEFTVAAGKGRTLAMTDVEVREVACLPPVPSAGPVLRSAPSKEAVEDAAIYGGDGVWPEERLAELQEYWMRHVPGVGVSIRPFQYDFARGRLLMAESLVFALRSGDATGQDYAGLDSQADFAAMQSACFANGELLGATRSDGLVPGHILLVAPVAWINNTDAFAKWKRQLGYDVTVAGYPLVGNADLGEYIASMITDAGVSHVILCGDCEDVPPAYTSTHVTSPSIYEPTSDVRYVLVIGDDYVPDAFISRVPSHDAARMKAVLQKFIDYEAAPPEDDAWRGKAAFMGSSAIADNQPYKGMRDREVMAENYAALMEAGVLPEGCAEVYAGLGANDNTLRSRLVASLNGGNAFMEYLGHGLYDRFVTSNFTVSNAQSLQNGSFFPFVLALVCDTGNFAYPDEDCLSEKFFLGAGSAMSRNGTIGVLASTSETYWNPPIRSIYEFTDLLCGFYGEGRLCSYGALCHQVVLAGARLAEEYHAYGSSYYHEGIYYYTRQMHLFGDCSMMPRLRSLRNVEVTYEFVSADQVSIKVAWADDGEPVRRAFVTMSDSDGMRVAARCADDGGEALFDCPQGTWSFFVNDASMRSVTLEVENEEGTLETRPLTLYAGQSVMVSVLPEGWEEGTVTYCSELPGGMMVSQDGYLYGMCDAPVEAEVFLVCQSPVHGENGSMLALRVLAGVDADGDGDVTTPELLEYLHACQFAAGGETAAEAAISLWQNSTATRGTGPLEEEKPLADSFREYNVTLVGDVTEELLAEAGAVVNGVAGDVAWIYADDEILERLVGAGIAPPLPDDSAGVPNARHANGEETPEATRGEAAHYPAYEEMTTELKDLAAAYPAKCRMDYIGRSVQKREILALRISNLQEDGEAPQLLVAAAIHGNERTGMVMALNLARYLAEQGDGQENGILDKAVFYIVPTMNPDGCEAVTRNNANGIDLNRGFPDGVQLAPLGVFAEGDRIRLTSRAPEVQGFMRWCASHRFSAALHLHTGDQLLCYPYGNYQGSKTNRISPDNDLFASLCNRYAEQNPDISLVMNASDYYTVIGEVPDWQYRYLGTLAVTVEMAGANAIGKEPKTQEELETLWEHNRPAILAWSEAAVTGISLAVTSALDGAPLPYAKVQASYGQAVYCDANGLCHRTLPEGAYAVTVSAPGYADVTLKGIDVADGQSISVPVALEPDGMGSRLAFSSLRSLPLLKGRMEARMDSSLEEPVVVTVRLPQGWTGTLASEPTAVRTEADGATSCLFLDASGAAAHLDLKTDEVTTDEDVVSVTTTWYVESRADSQVTEVKRHWLCAEPRQATLALEAGWNEVGGSVAFAWNDSSTPLWGYSGGAYAALKCLGPGQGALLFMEENATLALEGWYLDEDVAGQNPGWNLKSALRHRTNEGPFYRCIDKSYRKCNGVSTGDVYWEHSWR